ncbi:hypothetical protein MTR67_018588 [Solanum verrucosum]|uniref:Uncharacterized protein n=2 Tax=Solanum verrucosum TaxID=315347 RepID=A0AAF0QMT8_SOLVR|nr:hypothetical protein MTR67_018588 [Solanum verrucosum]
MIPWRLNLRKNYFWRLKMPGLNVNGQFSMFCFPRSGSSSSPLLPWLQMELLFRLHHWKSSTEFSRDVKPRRILMWPP